MIEAKKRAPLLRGTVFNSGGTQQIRVFCSYCDRHHLHGWPPGSKDAQHRWGHCTTDVKSPFHETGYMIEPFSQIRLEVVK